MRDIAHYKSLANQMIDKDKHRNTAFVNYEKAWHNEWELPAGVGEWVQLIP